MHAEANAIIAASREQMLDSTLYLACVDPHTKQVLGGTTSCSMCRRMIINAGISRVVIRESDTEFSVVPVRNWILNDDSMGEKYED